jgi:hypothetical protein
MSYFEDAILEIKTIIKSTWSMTDSQVFTTLQALEKNIVSSTANNSLALPIAVIEYGDQMNASYSIDRQSYYLPIVISRVDKQTNGLNIGGTTAVSQTTLSNNAAALQLAIRNKAISATPFVNFTLEDDGEINSGASNGVNSVLKLESKTPLLGVQLTYNPGLHVTPFG